MKFPLLLNKKLAIVAFLFIILVLILSSLYFYFQYQKTKELLQNPQQVTKDQTKKLLDTIGKLIELPKEEPTIATVTDKNKLNSQSFFKNADNGDKVLIFMAAKKAILYRPSINKIIEVMPIASNALSPTVTLEPTVQAKPTKIFPSWTPAPSKNP